MESLLRFSIDASLLAQWTTLIFGFISYAVKAIPPLNTILGLELIVQVIELVFYTWYKGHIHARISDVTRFRYYDWVVTTPIMLFSTMAYFTYNNLYNSESGEKPRDSSDFSIIEWMKKHILPMSIVLGANLMMLIFGYLQEIDVISIMTSSVFGFLAFGVSFYELYRSFVGEHTINRVLFTIMVTLWGTYGFAAMLPSITKNISYNILDIFSTNFYGVYLSYVILTHSFA
jgi:hypothetical protein